MAAPRKTQPETSTTPTEQPEQPDEQPTPEQPETEKAGVAPTDTEQANANVDEIAHAGDDGTEEVTLEKDAGGHRAGDTITVTHGAAAYLREQGYVLDGDEDDA